MPAAAPCSTPSAAGGGRTALVAAQNLGRQWIHKRTGRIIKLITVQEILDEQHVQKM